MEGLLPVYDLPREIKINIIRYLDIDSRRALGIYVPLRIPKLLSASCETALKKPIVTNLGKHVFNVEVQLGTPRLLYRVVMAYNALYFKTDIKLWVCNVPMRESILAEWSQITEPTSTSSILRHLD